MYIMYELLFYSWILLSQKTQAWKKKIDLFENDPTNFFLLQTRIFRNSLKQTLQRYKRENEFKENHQIFVFYQTSSQQPV